MYKSVSWIYAKNQILKYYCYENNVFSSVVTLEILFIIFEQQMTVKKFEKRTIGLRKIDFYY